MKQKFKVSIDRERDLISLTGDVESVTVNVGKTFFIGTAEYIINKIGNIYKISLVETYQSFRLYNNLMILLPDHIGMDNRINAIRNPRNNVESILSLYNIGYNVIQKENKSIRIPEYYRLQYTDGNVEDTPSGFKIYSDYNWIIIAEAENTSCRIIKIICSDYINDNRSALDSLSEQLAFLKKWHITQNIKKDSPQLISENKNMIRSIFKKYGLNNEQLTDVIVFRRGEDNGTTVEQMNGIDDDTVITDGMVTEYDSITSIPNAYKIEDFRYLIRFAKLNDGNKSTLKYKLAYISINENKLNMGLVYIIEHILSKYPFIKIYDEEKDKSYHLTK